MTQPADLSRPPPARWVVLLALTPFGCGKPATPEQCERILTRITELEMKAANVSNPEAVRSQVEQTKRTFDGAARSECVGRRISASVMDCVERASTAKQVVEECFD